MGSYTGTTIAFSHKGGFWKTRYSYTPTCYAAVDNVMISNNKTPSSTYVDQNALFWEHEVDATHNLFYGQKYKSSLTLVSNQDPSAVKLFKALSLESNSNNWAGTASTNISPAGAPQNELQLGSIKGFVTKEGNQYSELPKSLTFSSSNLDYVCQLNSIIDTSTVPPFLNLSDPDLPLVASGWLASVLSPSLNTPVLGGSGSRAIFVNNQDESFILSYESGWSLNLYSLQYSSFGINSPIPPSIFSSYAETATTNLWQINSPYVYIHSYNSDGTVTLGIAGNLTLLQFTDLVNFTNNLGPEWDTIQLYSLTSPDINGDPMRGHYLHLHLENTSTTPVETYAINVDFENTKLDGSKAAVKKKPKQKASPSSK